MKFTESINDGLHAIADGIRQRTKQLEIIQESQERDKLEGYLTDEDKIRMLKIDLYRRSRCGFISDNDAKHLEQLRKTIALLSNEIDYKRQRDYSLATILNEGARAFLGLGMLAVIASYVVQSSGACNSNNSKFCRDARIIPNTVEAYFQNETPLPSNENINIDNSNN